MSKIYLLSTSCCSFGPFSIFYNFSLAFSISFKSRTPVILSISLVSIILPSLSLSECKSSTPSTFSCSSPLLGSHSTDGLFSSSISFVSREPREDWWSTSIEPLFFRSGLFAYSTPKTLSASSKSYRICSMLDKASSSISSVLSGLAFLPILRGTDLLKVCVRSLGMILSNSR